MATNSEKVSFQNISLDFRLYWVYFVLLWVYHLSHLHDILVSGSFGLPRRQLICIVSNNSYYIDKWINNIALEAYNLKPSILPMKV